ncbi:MAG: aminotransferase class V-fold PLP-dependent enzyme [Acidobacteriaceae bacterium]|nr:aminotransferase class V-fold PLP-dependent enzyme [Acidobacteriaceae bacterium]
MSFGKILTESSTASTVWEEYRSLFPVVERFVYLNHASVAPVSRRAADAMKQLADDVLLYGSFHYDRWLDAYEGVRVAAAKLINADRGEIALVKNTSEGIATVAMGLNWSRGDRVVGFREEFPANLLPWKRLQSQGVEVTWLSIEDPLERVDEACRGARLLAISYVNFLSGYRVNLEAIGEICRRRGCFYFVDAIQGMGAFPIDVEAAGIDALAADGHKWMCGPEGCGVLYVRKGRQDEIEPVEFGWTNVADYNRYPSDIGELRPDAGRYEPGTLNTIGCFGLRAAIELILEIGVERITPQVTALADQIVEGVTAKGYELATARTRENAAGIVAFRRADVDARMVVRKLKDAGIQAAPRQGWVRMSPHFYLNSDDIGRMLAELP